MLGEDLFALDFTEFEEADTSLLEVLLAVRETKSGSFCCRYSSIFILVNRTEHFLVIISLVASSSDGLRSETFRRGAVGVVVAVVNGDEADDTLFAVVSEEAVFSFSFLKPAKK